MFHYVFLTYSDELEFVIASRIEFVDDLDQARDIAREQAFKGGELGPCEVEYWNLNDPGHHYFESFPIF